MRDATCDRTRTVVLDQIFFSLNNGKSRQFAAMLEAPPSHNPGLEHIMAVTAPWAEPATQRT